MEILSKNWTRENLAWFDEKNDKSLLTKLAKSWDCTYDEAAIRYRELN